MFTGYRYRLAAPPPRDRTRFQRWLRDEYDRIKAPHKTCLSIACLLGNLPVGHTDQLSPQARKLLRNFVTAHLKAEAINYIRSIDPSSGIPTTQTIPSTVEFLPGPELPADPFALSDNQLSRLVGHCQGIMRFCGLDGPRDLIASGTPLNNVMLNLGRFKDRLVEYYTGDPVSVVLLNAITELRQIGFHGIRICRFRFCRRAFYAEGKRLYCHADCRERAKNAKHRKSPETNERKALLMWKKSFRTSHKGKQPSEQAIKTWIVHYRAKRERLQRPVSKTPLKNLLTYA